MSGVDAPPRAGTRDTPVALGTNLRELAAALNRTRDRMDPDGPTRAAARARFRTTLIRVLVVQAVTMALLGVIQIVYNA